MFEDILEHLGHESFPKLLIFDPPSDQGKKSKTPFDTAVEHGQIELVINIIIVFSRFDFRYIVQPRNLRALIVKIKSTMK